MKNHLIIDLKHLRLIAQASQKFAATIAGAAADAIEELDQKKQNKLIGVSGQVVGFDSAGNPVAQSIPAGSGFPSGGIIIWSGLSTAIPDGWTLCDGKNGTPNLQDRFVLGAGTHTVGSTGGSENVKLTSDQMPEHNHLQRLPYMDGDGNRGAIWIDSLDHISGVEYIPAGVLDPSIVLIKKGTNQTSKSDITTYDSGNNKAHDNMPPYYTLCYIMKL